MPELGNVKIVEGFGGTWFYHLTNDDLQRALCGARTISTQLPLATWGQVGHLHERYCKECELLATIAAERVKR
jgi:hypothetical protein